MSFFRSLRGRVVLGALFWTLGLFTIGGVLLTHLMFRHPSAPTVFHRAFTNVELLSVLAAVLMMVGLMQVRRGVSPIAQLRHRLSSVHEGRSPRVDGDFPSEVQPLVDDLNALLAHHETAVARAQTKAGDLAHGLKTPLAVLAQEAAAADAAGHHDLAVSIRQQVDRMQRQIDYHLAHARAAASGASSASRCEVATSVDGLIRTVSRIYADRQLSITSAIPTEVIVQVQREDLDEMIGNLLDNACKWARTQVRILMIQGSRTLDIVVDDDGPGVPAERRIDVLRRGVRADEAAPGSGFGLAIVRDLADLYSGDIRLETSPLGGTRAVLTVPYASTSRT